MSGFYVRVKIMKEMKNVTRFTIRITGHVQGVGFRYHVQDVAMKYLIKGQVKNNADGSLEIDAEGTRTNLLSFIEEVKRGPEFARIDKCETKVEIELQHYSTFTVE